MTNREIAQQFEILADLLEFRGENAFKVVSYRKAARVIDELGEDIVAVAAAGRLRELPGIGEGIAKKIVELVETGRMKRLEDAREGVPAGILDIMSVPGVGPKKAALFYKQLGIASVEALAEAAEAGRLRALPGMGEKSEENILRGVRLARAGSKRMLLNVALDAAMLVIEELKGQPGLVTRITPAGSLRRWRESVGDVDILACGPDAAKIIAAFTGGSFAAEVLAAGETKASVIVRDGLQVDLRVVEPAQFGAALQYFTGSKDHNVRLRGIAKDKGMKVNEYGLFRGEAVVASSEEEEIYRVLGLAFIEPELRENRGEIEAAAEGRLPALIEQADIGGDFHIHSNWSDGADSVEELARAAKAIGYSFIAVTDHSKSLGIANGLTEERARKQLAEIRALNRRLRGIRVLAGIEVDIKADGSLDLPDALLAELDVVIASIHSGFREPGGQIMSRLASAARNPHVDIIGHPTGRLISGREAYDVDVSELIRLAAETRTVLEINAHPERLDLSDVNCRMAKERGVMLAIGTDAHDARALGLMQYGVSVARRGWLEPSDVLNASPKPVMPKHR